MWKLFWADRNKILGDGHNGIDLLKLTDSRTCMDKRTKWKGSNVHNIDAKKKNRINADKAVVRITFNISSTLLSFIPFL